MRKFRAPGRINIIGEHTDYNDGFVLPFSLNMHIQVEMRRSNKFKFYSESMDEYFETEKIEKTGRWMDYVLGVFWAFKKMNYKIEPMEVYISSTLPIGAGLSSSAALEVSVAYGISKIMNHNISKMDLVRIAREAEVEFVGVRCGIMDQFTAVFGKKNFAIFLDTMNLDYEYVPLKLDDYEFKLIDSKVKHELGSSEYNKRRIECENILKKLGKKSFREITFENIKQLDDDTLRKRALHVLNENERVLKCVEYLKGGEIKELGKMLYESHRSLKELYEVSCDEIDFIVDSLRKYKEVTGARMIGGGFGGGIIVLVKKDMFSKVIDDVKKAYLEKFKIELDYMNIESEEGVKEVE